VKNERRNRAPVAANLHDVERGVERTERRADRIHHGIGIDPGLSRPSQRAVAVVDDYRFAIPLWSSAVEKRKGGRCIRGGIERSARSIVQTLERL
jgi:hypothetical protein